MEAQQAVTGAQSKLEWGVASMSGVESELAVVALSGALGFALRWASRGFALITALLIRFPLRYPIYELLRRLVYRPSFWRQALRYAVLDAKAVTEKFVDNYSCPRRILDWYGFPGLLMIVERTPHSFDVLSTAKNLLVC